jgi:hypothetical protein
MIELQLTENQGKDICVQYLKRELLIMKQYLSDDIKQAYLLTIKNNCIFWEYDDFVQRYERAQG